MIIEFEATNKIKGSFSISEDELLRAKENWVNIDNLSELAVYFSDKWGNSCLIEEFHIDKAVVLSE